MTNLEYIKTKAKKYDLVAEFLNCDTLKVYSPKYFFDSWLVKETDEGIELWHLSKKNNLKKCSYHLQAVIPKKYKIRALQRINSHNKYTTFYKHKNKVNLVDRVLGEGRR